jgi:hypothetical protein
LNSIGLAFVGLCFFASHAPATVRYVNVNNASPATPYTSWATAATNIQSASDLAMPGDLILVTNGVYQTGTASFFGLTRVVVHERITVQSVNGPEVTIIKGYQMPGITNGASSVSCVYLPGGSTLSGFTLTNGSTLYRGGGIFCKGYNAIVTNCIIIGNSASRSGGGGDGGTYINCIISDNTSFTNGGGLDLSYGVATNCAIIGNRAQFGAGVYAGVVNNSLISSNRASVYGGGAYSNTLNNCTIRSNSTVIAGGGAIYSTLNNCLLTGNFAGGGGGGAGGGASTSTLSNCTIAGNIATAGGGGTESSTLNNCIIYYNIGGLGDNNSYNGILNYCCTIPLPTNGIGNITNEPTFVDLANGNVHLQSNSPCINAGNNSYITVTTDLDGNPRIVGGTVDMGACECQSPALLAFYVWLQNYDLPTDASAMYADTDGDGMNNWNEWQSGTIPTNALSLLQMITVTHAVPGITVTWQSVSGKTYFLQRCDNLMAQPLFSTIASNLVGQAGTTSYMDPTAVGPGPVLYRVGVQP